MVIGSPGIVADATYDDINMTSVKNLIHHYYKHWRFPCRFCFSQNVDIG